MTDRTTPGHLFVVHGRIESVVHDAAVVPTSDSMHLRKYWRPLLGGRRREDVMPAGWPGQGWGRAADSSNLWFVSVGATSRIDVDAVVERTLGAVRSAAESPLGKQENRVLPVIAVPVTGIAGGGHGERRGDLLKALMAGLQAAAAELRVDVALVTPDAAVHAAAQRLRSPLLDRVLTEALRTAARELGERARRGELALFLGAGASIPAGLPTWDELLRQLATDYDGSLVGLPSVDQAELLAQRFPDFRRRVADRVKGAGRPSLAHALLASLGCREVVTTNYDTLYEQAVSARGAQVTRVLPGADTPGANGWVLKLHGDVQRPRSIVLTRRSFVLFDSRTRPAGALLQSLLMTRHLLVVGASMQDDNVVRLMHEVEDYRESNKMSGRFGTLLDVDAAGPRRELWDKQIDWISMPGAPFAETSRALEIFLDLVAHHATDDSSWLLDDRFASLLAADGDRGLAARLRTARADIPEGDPAWADLAAALDRFGARPR